MKEGTTRRRFILASTLSATGITSLSAAADTDQTPQLANEAQKARLAMRSLKSRVATRRTVDQLLIGRPPHGTLQTGWAASS